MMKKSTLIQFIAGVLIVALTLGGLIWSLTANKTKTTEPINETESPEAEGDETPEPEAEVTIPDELSALLEAGATDDIFNLLGELGLATNVTYGYDGAQPNYWITYISCDPGDILKISTVIDVTININEQWQEDHSLDHLKVEMPDLYNNEAMYCIEFLGEQGITDIVLDTYYTPEGEEEPKITEGDDYIIPVGYVVKQSKEAGELVLPQEYRTDKENDGENIVLTVYGGILTDEIQEALDNIIQ